MAQGYLIDTSAAIKYLNSIFPVNGINFLDSIIDDNSAISFISQIELLCWNPESIEDEDIFKEFVSLATIINVDLAIIEKTIEIRKGQKLKLPDAIIAATALVSNLTLVSDNEKDFLKVPQLKHINPFKL